MSEKSNLFLFNLSMDLDNPILATTNLWVNEFAKNFENVYVYSTHVGRYEVPNNVRVTELGGGSLRIRLLALAKLMTAASSVIRLRRSSVVFHHQSPITSVFPGLFLYLTGIKQGLWYSHSSKPLSLTVGVRFVNKIFSSAPQSLPMGSSKAIFLGHGIDTVRAESLFRRNTKRQRGILYLGRISPIKKLEECINALAHHGNNKIFFVAIGPTDSDEIYLERLNAIALEKNVCFRRELPINHELVFEQMAQFSLFFAGMKNSVDKSCLEAAASGCFIITTDQASADLSGMSDFWLKVNGKAALPKLSEQIRIISNINPQLLESYRPEVSSKAIELNSVTKLINRIATELKVI